MTSESRMVHTEQSLQLLVERSDVVANILPPEEIQAEDLIADGGIYPIGTLHCVSFFFYKSVNVKSVYVSGQTVQQPSSPRLRHFGKVQNQKSCFVEKSFSVDQN